MKLLTFARRHLVLVSTFGILIIILAIIGGRMAGRQSIVTTDAGPRRVSLTNVANYREGYTSIPADGVVEARSQADLKSQISAPVSANRVSIGDNVYSGQVIMELESADIRAQLAQAEANLELARGQYQTGGASLESAKKSAVDRVKDSYFKAYDVLYSQIDPILYNYDGNGARLTSLVTDSNLVAEIRDIRIDLTNAFSSWKASTAKLSYDSDPAYIHSVMDESEKNLATVDRLLNAISNSINDLARTATPDFAAFLDKWKAVVSSARTVISGSVQGLTAAESVLTTSQSSQSLSAPAQVRAAEAGVNNLRAQLAKTVVRSPISGQIAALPLRPGELASPGTLLATVVGEGGMIVRAYASAEDSSRIQTGSPVTIRGTVNGTVEGFSKSVGATSKKVEVVVKVTDPDNSGLIIGDSVGILISAGANPTASATPAKTGAKYILPIQNVKIVPGSAYVFTIDSESRIKRRDVMLGEVRGDFVEVVSGLDDSMDIATPVYELEEGQKVTIQ